MAHGAVLASYWGETTPDKHEIQELEKYINLRQARSVVAPCRLISEPTTHEANLLDKYHWCENISTDDCGSSSWAK